MVRASIITAPLRAMWGFGDTLYTLAWLRAADPSQVADLTVMAPWHELYRLLPNPPTLLAPDERFRGALYARSAERARASVPGSSLRSFEGAERAALPRDARSRITYTPAQLEAPGASISSVLHDVLKHHLPIPPAPRRLDIPLSAYFPAWSPRIIVKQAATRALSGADARACDPAYLHRAVAILHERGHQTENATLPTSEHLIGPPLSTSVTHDSTSWDGLRYLQWLSSARALVGTVGSFTPAAMHANRPALVIMGGYQGHNSPSQLAQAPIDGNITYLQVDHPCPCSDLMHGCDKRIAEFDKRFVQWCISAGL